MDDINPVRGLNTRHWVAEVSARHATTLHYTVAFRIVHSCNRSSRLCSPSWTNNINNCRRQYACVCVCTSAAATNQTDDSSTENLQGALYVDFADTMNESIGEERSRVVTNWAWREHRSLSHGLCSRCAGDDAESLTISRNCDKLTRRCHCHLQLIQCGF